jgi:hypothetical protein
MYSTCNAIAIIALPTVPSLSPVMEIDPKFGDGCKRSC